MSREPQLWNESKRFHWPSHSHEYKTFSSCPSSCNSRVIKSVFWALNEIFDVAFPGTVEGPEKLLSFHWAEWKEQKVYIVQNKVQISAQPHIEYVNLAGLNFPFPHLQNKSSNTFLVGLPDIVNNKRFSLVLSTWMSSLPVMHWRQKMTTPNRDLEMRKVP